MSDQTPPAGENKTSRVPTDDRAPHAERFPEDPPEDELRYRRRDADLDIAQTPPPAD